ncbi:MAG: molybdopterin dinucleotide binding domain-containing protein, partial [Acidobacteriota bacterium]
LRVPGQINAESEVQGLSRKYFMGRMPMTDAAEAAQRMGLPADAYQRAVEDSPRAALDYSEPTPGERELFLCVGTQFEANMPNRQRWLDKLTDPANTLVVIDPIPDPWSLQHAELIIPSPPHPATTKLYQNGEWKLSLSVPQKQAPPETRSDATLLYDAMAEIARRLGEEPELAARHGDLAAHLESGYLQRRFCPPDGEGDGLSRLDGEVSRVELWQRVQDYLHGGSGPLYCSFDHADGTPITWAELLEHGSVIYGGVGENRYKLDYDNPAAVPFADIYRKPGAFKFFRPTDDDLAIPDGVLFNSGRSALSDDRQRIHFATSTFNSGKATPVVKMPDEHPLHVSPFLAERMGLETGDRVKVTGRSSGNAIELPVVVTDRVKGETVYVSFHRAKAQERRGLYINDVTDHIGRCPYSGQSQLKIPQIKLERIDLRARAEADLAAAEAARATSDAAPVATTMVANEAAAAEAAATEAATATPGPAEDGAPESSPRASVLHPRRIDMTVLDTEKKIPLWNGEETSLYVADIFQETHDAFTFRFQGDPLCRFAYKPGQFSSVVLDIDGKKVVRS